MTEAQKKELIEILADLKALRYRFSDNHNNAEYVLSADYSELGNIAIY